MSIDHITETEPAGVLSEDAWVVPLSLGQGGAFVSVVRPVQFGVCLPQGFATADVAGRLHLRESQSVSVQTEPLTRYADGSIHWLQIDANLPAGSGAIADPRVVIERPAAGRSLTGGASGGDVAVPCGASTVRPRLSSGRFCVEGDGFFRDAGIGFEFKNRRSTRIEPRWSSLTHETAGSVRNTFLLCGTIGSRKSRLNVKCRLNFYAESGFIKIDVCLHNPHRARHAGGLWDLGDPGSVLFEDFSVRLLHSFDAGSQKQWVLEQDGSVESGVCDRLHLYQDSSGGEHWDSPNHVNRDGRVPCRFRGYRCEFAGESIEGNRATPVMAIGNDDRALAVAIPEFWQQFPKCVELDDAGIRVGLFPEEADDLHELQGGEQKTSTFWVNFSSGTDALDRVVSAGQSVLTSVAMTPAREVFADCGTVPDGTDILCEDRPELDRLIEAALEGDRSLYKKREEIDEYGWRNYGELVADHEEAHYDGPLPLISHYNNQFDPIYGFLLNYLRTGDSRLFELGDALARHVSDVDIYHTSEDKWSYNGGMFWHTDHYRHARTATHRSYSKGNFPERGDYGGGPCNEQNYTTGLFLHYCLTGRDESRDAVLELANWVIRMDDGNRSLFRFIAPRPTGLASATREEAFHGPGRGAGNSINAMLDAWRLSRNRLYLDFAEVLIQRCIHPQDDLQELDLLNAEDRWSYTVFLTSLQKYLKVKAEAEEFDRSYAYARSSLVHFASWMSEYERPYLDHSDELEYPTETWAAQDLRKANVLRHASAYVEEPLRGKFLEGGSLIAERVWKDLWSFETASCARPLAILMVEGLKELHSPPPSLGNRSMHQQPGLQGKPTHFVGQKTRIKQMLKHPLQIAKGIFGK